MIDSLTNNLRQIVRIARTGHEFFVSVYPRIDDPQVRMAFAYLIEVKAQLVADLNAWLPPADPADGAHTPVAAAVEQIYAYADAYWYIRGDTPTACAHELGHGEAQLLQLVQRALALARQPALRDLLGAVCSQLVICRESLWRLRMPAAA
ncbi:MAG: hypothetical protein ACREPN_08690 [Rudaea sp.]